MRAVALVNGNHSLLVVRSNDLLSRKSHTTTTCLETPTAMATGEEIHQAFSQADLEAVFLDCEEGCVEHSDALHRFVGPRYTDRPHKRLCFGQLQVI